MDEPELHELAAAKRLLEHPGLATRITNVLGKPLEYGIERLPARVQGTIQKATRAALTKALDVAISSLGRGVAEGAAPAQPRRRLHKAMAAASGATGGAFGFMALAMELPISTVIMLRSIADIARAEGEDLSRPETQLACLQVFALGGRSKSDDAAETGYYAVRAAMARAVSDALTHLAQRGATREGAPAMVRFLVVVAERFGIVVSEKVAAQLIPVLGAVGGATVNLLFLEHFQDMARGHFTVRRLERRHGAAAVQEAYERA